MIENLGTFYITDTLLYFYGGITIEFNKLWL